MELARSIMPIGFDYKCRIRIANEVRLRLKIVMLLEQHLYVASYTKVKSRVKDWVL